MSGTQSLLLATKELREAFLNKWFWLYTVIFALLALALARFGLSGIGEYGAAGFGRTVASLINLVLLIVPLMGLSLGALSLASERERGTLLYLLSHPVGKTEVLFGKYVGLGLALAAALGMGFGVAGLSLGVQGGTAQVGDYLLFVLLSWLLALGSLSLGVLISVVATRSATAVGVAIFLWLLLIFLSDLGLLGASLVLKLKSHQLLTLAFLNPAQVFKMAAILLLRGGLEVLGPVGLHAMRTYGHGLFPLLLGLLLLWVGLPLLAAWVLFQRKEGG